MAHVEHVVWMTFVAPELAGQKWRYELGRIEVPEQGGLTGVLREKFAEWQPSRGELGVDERGRRPAEQRPLFAWRTLDVNDHMKLHEDLLDALLPVLPATPVGPGASWRFADQMVRGSVSVDRRVRYQLVGSAARPRLHVVVELVGGPQQVTTIMGKDLVAYPLESWKVVVESEYDWDGRGLLPDQAEISSRVDFSLLAPGAPTSKDEKRELHHNRVEISASLSR